MTANINDKNIDQDTVKRIEQGKLGKLWCITILCKDGPTTMKWCRANQYWSEIQFIRESIFKFGVMIPVTPGKWLVIPPWDMLDIRVEKQRTLLDLDPTKE